VAENDADCRRSVWESRIGLAGCERYTRGFLKLDLTC
jgi:hypothetical protein